MLVFSPDGDRLAYVVRGAGAPKGNAVFVDGESMGAGYSFAFPVFSPDSRHFATVAAVDQAWQIIVDGRAGPSYKELVDYGPNAVSFLDSNTLRVLAVKDDSVYRVILRLDD